MDAVIHTSYLQTQVCYSPYLLTKTLVWPLCSQILFITIKLVYLTCEFIFLKKFIQSSI